TSSNEFQKAQHISDVMSFYRAMGLEPDGDRPDSMSIEMEFMHYLLYKRLNAKKTLSAGEAGEKESICLDMEKKFFADHLYPAARKLAEGISASSSNGFYLGISRGVIEFIEEEKKFMIDEQLYEKE
ncbi:MAG: molecular chaperone TorD family protein, partial [Deltaproteobacteria bacterium]|nr:molecular chaperone TorD family protein [Deltaproteobacteria bacterium]